MTKQTLESIDLAALDTVIGGSGFDVGPIRVDESDYSLCTRRMTNLAADQVPDQRTWGQYLTLQPDPDLPRRATQAVQNIHNNCPLPNAAPARR